MVSFLQGMEKEDEFRIVPSWKAHLLTGDREGSWSLLVTKNRRMTFPIDQDEIAIIDLDYEDYREKMALDANTGILVKSPVHLTGSSVGRPEVQAFIGSLVGLGANKGVFVTTSAPSAQAVEFVSRIPQRVILRV